MIHRHDFESRMDPEILSVLDAVPRLDLRDIPRAREERAELAKAGRARWSPDESVRTQDHHVAGPAGAPDVRVRVHAPARPGGPAAAMLWMHGGGHVLGDAEQDDPFLQSLVMRTGCVAVSVDWSRAPEHPYPAAIEDSYAALAWLVSAASELSVDPARIVVGGASSGGGLAAGLALLARDRGTVELAGQLLIYPMLDDRELTASSRTVHDPRVWNHESNRIAWAAYLGDAATEPVSPYAAPARALDLTGLPRTWMATAELDLFRDEDINYAQRLLESGVSTELHVLPAAVHGFDLFAPDAAVTRRFCQLRDEACDRFLGR